MINRDYLGHESAPTSIDVELGQIRLFCKSIGETNPIYTDNSAALEEGHRGAVAPPTFGTCLASLAPETGPSYDELGLDNERLLHGEESYIYHGPIFAGDRITLATKITNIFEKKGGALEFLVTNTTLTNQLGELVQEIRSTLVMRNG